MSQSPGGSGGGWRDCSILETLEEEPKKERGRVRIKERERVERH